MSQMIREHIYLAALLHDIGKFYQRADTGAVATSKFLSPNNKREEDFLPSYNGRYTHKHCLWTAQFIDDFKSVFKNLVSSNFDNLSDKDNLINLAARHHLPENELSDLGRIIKKADCLSSGMDRSNTESFKDTQDEENWDSFKNKRMVSILETVRFNNQPQREIKYHTPVDNVKLNKDFFPKNNFAQAPDYEKLWNGFITEMKFIQSDTYRAYAETFLNLLYKYAVTVPSSTINFPDVSLYDHLKTTAALAVCLYDVKENPDSLNSENQFLLIGADVSGIQKYIYSITSKYAAKNLKGRSFYLRILTDSIVRYILKELKLFQANVVYNSGGGFYIIAPNTKTVRDNLAKAVKKIESQLFATHDTSLYVAIDKVELSDKDLMSPQNLSAVWTKLFNKRDKKKNSKFADLISANYDKFFNPAEKVALEQDAISGDEIKGQSFELDDEKENDPKRKRISSLSDLQIQMGKKLKECDELVVSEEELTYWNNIKEVFKIQPIDLGLYYYLLSQKALEAAKEKLRASADKVSVITLNGNNLNCDFVKPIQGFNNIYGLEFYGGNQTDNSRFEKLITADYNDSDSFKRLGVLRMDVDNLGTIFQEGLEHPTLSRYSALSRSFDYFFCGYLNKIQQDISPDNSFIIYSGGDDLFIVADWKHAIQTAKQIRNDFKEFACQNSDFTISGGISIIDPRYPIMKAASDSSNEESNAKKHIFGEGKFEKNSISFMNFPINWDEEFPVIEELKDTLCKTDLPSSFRQKVLQFWSMADNVFINYKKEGISVNHKIHPKTLNIYWLLAYDLERFKERNNQHGFNDLIDNCINECCHQNGKLNGTTIKTQYHPLELWAFACRWAELELRSK